MSKMCCAVIWDSSFSRFRPKQCSKVAKVERSGKHYCTIHDPERIAQKKAERSEKWEEKYREDEKRRLMERAAPYLYEAALELNRSWTQEFPSGPDGESEPSDDLLRAAKGRLSPETIELWRKFRAALAKAEGKI